jgi:hypothetical protein
MAMVQTTDPTRRNLLSLAATVALLRIPFAKAADMLPSEVGGISIPKSTIAMNVAAYARATCPDFLFNHCMRTFLFGALSMQKLGRPYNADEAFVAAALHDLGLVKAFESERASLK